MSSEERQQLLLTELWTLRNLAKLPAMTLLKTFAHKWGLFLHYIPSKFTCEHTGVIINHTNVILCDGGHLLLSGAGMASLSFESKVKAARNLIDRFIRRVVAPPNEYAFFDEPVIRNLHLICEIQGLGEPECEIVAVRLGRAYIIKCMVLRHQGVGYGVSLEKAYFNAASTLLERLKLHYQALTPDNTSSDTAEEL